MKVTIMAAASALVALTMGADGVLLAIGGVGMWLLLDWLAGIDA
jgi:uncharacterized membrane protein (DUF2068 family)